VIGMSHEIEEARPWRNLEGYFCFGCCPENPAGIALRPVATASGLACSFSLDRRHESYPGVIHGGVATAVLDEIMGNALVFLLHKACFTISLRSRFLAPIRTGRTYQAVATIRDRPGPSTEQFTCEGEILNEHGESALFATGTYRWITAEQAGVMHPNPASVAEFRKYFK
jgi:acyl-coenzyme A thioesterase PaaI-like protein